LYLSKRNFIKSLTNIPLRFNPQKH